MRSASGIPEEDLVEISVVRGEAEITKGSIFVREVGRKYSVTFRYDINGLCEIYNFGSFYTWHRFIPSGIWHHPEVREMF